MTAPEKHIVVALTLATILVIFNIVAVIQGTAVEYYDQIEQFINSLLPTP